MREIVLDTETTGLDPGEGHRIVEIGAIELCNYMPTGRSWHRYLNPERPVPAEAFAVHGLGDDFLAGKPRFAEIAGEFLEFIGDARLVIHNAAFDLRFLNAELVATGLPALPPTRAVDTLELARRRFPGAPASLDALCRRFAIDSSSRSLHGALLDAKLLAEIYLHFMGGSQPGLALDTLRRDSARAHDGAVTGNGPAGVPPRPRPLRSRVTEAESRAHDALVARLGESGLWTRSDG